MSVQHTINRAQRTISVKLALPAGSPAAPGMYALAWIAQASGNGPSVSAPAIPLTAVTHRGSQPLAFVVDFRRRGQPRSSDACLAWVGQNLLHIGRYAADARAQRLPLVGGGEHDWTYLLETVGLLARDAAVGQAFDFAGCLLIAWAGVSIWDRTRSRRSSRGLILAAFFLTPVAVDAAPPSSPEKAVVRVMRNMRAALRYRPEAPAPRGPHEWNARRVLEAGTFEEVQGPGESPCLVLDGTQLAMLLSGVSLVASGRRRRRYSPHGREQAA